MTLTLDLDLSLEKKLKSAASQNGTSAKAFAIDTIKGRLAEHDQQIPLKHLSIPSLLGQINSGIPEEEWTRYSKLITKRNRAALSRKELVELREMSDRIEVLNARRLELVAELARRRGTDLDIELRKLGIEPRHV